MDKETQLISGERQLKSFGSFLENYDDTLKKLLRKDHDEYDEFFLGKRSNRISKKLINPIKLDFSANRENISIFQLVESDNKVLNKIILTFVHLCEEVDQIETIAREYQQKFLYLDEDLYNYEDAATESKECYIKISKSLEFLCNVQFLIQRCIIVASTILHQLGALFNHDEQPLDVHLNVEFQAVFDSLASVIVQLIIFDEILFNSNFSKFWSSFKKTINSVYKTLDKFKDISPVELNGLINILNDLEIPFSGNLFQIFLDETFKLKEQIGPKALGILSGHFQDYIKKNLTIIEKFNCDLSEFSQTELIVRINVVSVLYHNFFGHIDQKSFKHLIELNLKHVGITLVGNIVWCPEPFLRKHAETLTKHFEKYLQDASRFRQIQLQAKVQNLQRDTKSYGVQITLWSLNMRTSLENSVYDLKLEQFKRFCNLLLEGMQFSGQLSHMIKSITNLHVMLQSPMSKSTLMAICKLIEYLKMIQLIFCHDLDSISKTIQCVVQYLQYKALFIISAIKKKLSSESYSDRNLDILAALQIAEKCLYGPVTKRRILIANLSVSVTNQHSGVSSEYYQKLTKILNRLKLLSSLQDNLAALCDTSFMYWHQSILLIYLRQVVEKSSGINSFRYVIKSTDDCRKSIEMLDLNGLKLLETLKKSNYDHFKTELLDKLCGQVETFLRIEAHSNLQQEKINPLEKSMNDSRDLINSCPILINDCVCVVKDHVENYLTCMFYNLTTISLHDWKTYAEMRHFAREKFNLDTIEDHLPTQTLEQGIDVLEIMRNIHVFVSKYLYNMNNQIFIEQSSNNKHLNTIGIRHIANSLRTHGTGIINTTINFTYQFLRKKFYTFSQFLFDEQIKSRLMKDLKYFRDNKEKLNQKYSYDRADSFNKGIRKLGLSPEGQSYLDLFRQLITHIGNAMGYIRLVRSGSIHANYSASIYLPKLNENLLFSQYSNDDRLPETIVKAADNLETNIGNLSENFSEGMSYFRMLVDAFSPFFRDSKNIHLRNFFLIIPPLTINFVEYMLNAKDKIHKKDKNGALFVDDGFAIGVTYILTALNQMSDFQSLHWFESVKQKFNEEQVKIGHQCNMSGGPSSNTNSVRGDVKLQQALALTEKRIAAYQMEFNLLYYSLSGSKIFFH